MRRILVCALIICLLAPSADAQLVVIDPGNLAQATLIAERTLSAYQNLVAQYETLLRMAQGLGNMSRYRLPAATIPQHDPSRWVYGAPWLQGLNAGDLRGVLYRQVTRPVASPAGVLDGLPAAARKAIQNAYATIEITDAVAAIAGNQVAAVRAYSGALQPAIQSLEDDIANPSTRYHELTAQLDEI